MATPLRVLVVEDSRDDAELLMRELSRSAYELISEVVDTEEEYLAALDRQTWDLVLCDHGLPRFNSVKALEDLKERGLDIPFLIVSGLIGEDVAVAAMKAGASDYIMKGQLARLVPAVERELREAEVRRARRLADLERARLTSIIEATPDFVGITDAQGGGIWLNPAGRRLLGLGPDERISGSSFLEYHPLGVRGFVRNEAIPAAIRNGVWRGETALLTREGRQIPVSQVIIAHKVADGSVRFISTIIRDIRDIKQAEKALKEANQHLQEALAELRQTRRQAIQQERLHALQQMAGAIAHDVNNLLTPIAGYTELLLSQPGRLSQPDVVRRDLQTINRAAGDVAGIISRLHLFCKTRGVAEEFRLIDPNSLIKEAASLSELRWGTQAQANGVKINVETDLQEVPPIEGDEIELREALINLVFNAADAMPSGGTLALLTRHERNHVLLQVKDTGLGMSREVLRRCTEPFFTTKGSGGTGLGLAVVHGTVQRHRGSLKIESKLGKGTTVTLQIPARRGKTMSKQETHKAAPPRSLRILVVDDEPLPLQTIAAYLAGDGHVVETAPDGRQALEKLGSGIFDVLVTDLAMPEMNGASLATVAKTMVPDLPVILLSGFADQFAGWDRKGEAFQAIVSKPLDVERLRRALEQVTRLK